MRLLHRFLLVLCLFLFFEEAFSQQVYYVSADGTDSASGLSEGAAWQTVGRVNDAMGNFSAGDQILFRRGDLFEGRLTITSSGVTVGAYGVGERPVLTGRKAVQGTWAEAAPGLWEVALSSPPAAIRNLFGGEQVLPLSRHPNKSSNNGYFNMTGSVGKIQFSDTGLTGVWNGADVVIRAEKYRLVRTKVADQVGTTITIEPRTDIINSFRSRAGYFFCNDRRAIDQEGEWAYETAYGKLVLKSESAPVSISYPVVDTVVSVSGADQVTLENLEIAQGNLVNVSILNSNDVVIRGCRIRDAGGEGISFDNVGTLLCENNEVTSVIWSGIIVQANCSNAIIRGNSVQDVGNEAYGKEKVFFGIYNLSVGAQILNNNLLNILGIGILATGQNTVVKRNVVDNANFGLEDYGSIYTNNNLGVNNGMLIEENIVRNSTGERFGMPDVNSQAQGIYADNNSSGVTIRHNTVYNVAGSAYYFNAFGPGNRLIGNTAFGPGQFELEIKNTKLPGYNVEVTGNVFVPNTDSTFHRSILVLSKDSPQSLNGPFRDNTIVHLYDVPSANVQYYEGGLHYNGYHTPHDWNFAAENAGGNRPGPIQFDWSVKPEDVLQFLVNPTGEEQVFALPAGYYLDTDGQGYSGSVTVAPFRSRVLTKFTGNTTGLCTVPANPASDSVTDVSAVLKWDSVPGSFHYDLRFRMVGDTVWEKMDFVKGSDGFTIRSLNAGGDYEWQVRSMCYQNLSDWSSVSLFSTLPVPPNIPPVNAGVKELLGTSTFFTWDLYLPALAYQARYKSLTDTSWMLADSTWQTEVFVSSLTTDTDYEFQVRSYTVSGWSPWSGSHYFATPSGGMLKRIIADSPNHWLVRDRITGVKYHERDGPLFIGRGAAATESGIAVFPFKFPGLATGQILREAEGTLMLDGPMQQLDTELWGLAYRNSPAYDLEDYHDWTFSGANQASATLLQDPWIRQEALNRANPQTVNLTTPGRNNLKSYLLDQYQDGADGSKWFFLRVNPTIPSYDFRLMLDRTEDTNDDYKPHVTVVLSALSTDIPDPVANLTSSVSGGNISLEWDAADVSATALILEKRIGNGYYQTLDTLAAGATSFVDTRHKAGEIYRYRVLSYNHNGSRGFSDQSTIVYPLSAPSGVAGVIRVSDGAVNLSWDDENVNRTHFVIERKGSAGDFTVAGAVPGNQRHFLDDQTPGVLPVTYRVKAMFEEIASEYSDELTLTNSDVEIGNLFTATSTANGTASNLPVYQYVVADGISALTYPTFTPVNLPGGCFYSVQAVFEQSASSYSATLGSYVEFELKSAASHSLLIREFEIKARKAAGVDFTMKYRLAYSIGNGPFVDNGVDLIPTVVGCSAAGYGTNFGNLVTQTWTIPDLHVTDPDVPVRFRIYYFDQPSRASMGLPYLNIRGALMPVPLEVSLASFAGSRESSSVNLHWTTARENNSGHFEIQRSYDGIGWTGISKMEAALESDEVRRYSYVDAAPLNGVGYYRLKMVDGDANYTYSSIVAVDGESRSSYAYPNPVSEYLKIADTDRSEIVSVSLVTLAGRVVYQAAVMQPEGIPVSGYPSGIYLLKIIRTGDRVSSHRITIKN